MKRFEHKNVLVTGGASGIGLAICHRLTSEGAKLVFIDRNVETGKTVEDELKHLGQPALFVQADLTDEEAVEGAFAAVLENLGQVDVLVNNAGTNRPALCIDYTETDYDDVMALNVRSVYFTTRAVARGLVAANLEGSIINISSQMGHVGGPGRTVYCAS